MPNFEEADRIMRLSDTQLAAECAEKGESIEALADRAAIAIKAGIERSQRAPTNIVDDLVATEWREGVSPGAAARQMCRSLGAYSEAPKLKELLEAMLADSNRASHREADLCRAVRLMLAATGVENVLFTEDPMDLRDAQVEALAILRRSTPPGNQQPPQPPKTH